MAGKDVSYQFLDALAKSVGMGAETVKQAPAEINQLQTQTQALEVAVQGKAPTNHASQQPIFGTADEQMYGHVKIVHEVTDDSTDGVAVSPDAVFAYTLGYSAGCSIVGSEMLVDGDVSFCRATPGLLFFQFFLRGESVQPKGTPLLKISGYTADVDLTLFSGESFSFKNEEGAIIVSSPNDLAITGYSVLVPAHKL